MMSMAGRPPSAAIASRVQMERLSVHRHRRTNTMQENCPCTSARDAEPERGVGTPAKRPRWPNGRCRMHGGMSPGAPKGNKNELKHRRYTAEAIAGRRK